MDSIDETTNKIRIFRDRRDWLQFHSPKNLACSIVLEASELLEHFQWKSDDASKIHANNNKEEIANEIADIAIYLIEIADNLGIDLLEAVDRKLKINAQKYPVAKAKGNSTKYTKLL